jgi:4-aminobutyrate aminotransferase-like enzyme
LRTIPKTLQRRADSADEKRMHHPELQSLLDSPRVREAARALIAAVAEESRARALAAEDYAAALREIEALRGRPLSFPLLLSEHGHGARVRMADGRWLLDFIGGIGVYGFGHSHPELLEAAVVAAAGDSVFQGHLAPGPEYLRLSRLLVEHAGPRLAHAWISLSGSMANENALKLILQKHAPADRIVAFERNFAGRTLASGEITDKPAYREGMPLRGNVLYVPFFDEADPRSTQKSVAALDAHLARHPGRTAGMIFELVQGEGGFNTAPREFFAALMERCRKAGIAVWVDEVQTFARTGQLFAFQTLGLGELVDVVTLGKLLQGSAALFTRDYNPKPGLIAGTFAGATVGMAVGARVIEKLVCEGYLGPEGRVAKLGLRVAARHETLRRALPRAVGPRCGIGAMQAFVPFDGSAELVQAVLRAAFEEGLLAFSAGANPGKIRMLLPLDVSDEELDAGFAIFEKAIRRVAEEKGLPC